MQKRDSKSALDTKPKRPQPPVQETEEEGYDRFRASYLYLWRICKKRRCRRARVCLGPPTCIDLHWDFVQEMWPEARESILRKLDPRA